MATSPLEYIKTSVNPKENSKSRDTGTLKRSMDNENNNEKTRCILFFRRK